MMSWVDRDARPSLRRRLVWMTFSGVMRGQQACWYCAPPAIRQRTDSASPPGNLLVAYGALSSPQRGKPLDGNPLLPSWHCMLRS